MRRLIPLSVFLLAASALTAQTTTLYSTTDFSGWLLGTKPTITGGDLVTTSGTTNAAFAYFESPGNQYQFAVGTTLSLSVNFTLTGTPVSSSRTFYVTLQNSGSTNVTSNQLTGNLTATNTNAAFSTYTGYGLLINPSPSATSAGQFDYRSGANSAIVGSTSPWLLPGSPTAISALPSTSFTLNTTDSYNLTYTIKNVSATVMDFTYTMYDVTTSTTLFSTASPIEATGLSGGSYVTAFDTIALGASSAQTASYHFTDLTLTATTVPEPATYALGFGVIAVGFAAWRRRARRA